MTVSIGLIALGLDAHLSQNTGLITGVIVNEQGPVFDATVQAFPAPASAPNEYARAGQCACR